MVGRALDLVDPLDVDARARLEGGEGIGRDLATRGLGAGDRELDPEHGLEPGGVRPDRAHLGERVARDHRAATAATGAIGAGAGADVVAALEARRSGSGRRRRRRGSRRPRQVRAATDDRQDPAAGRAQRARRRRAPCPRGRRALRVAAAVVEAVDPVAALRRVGVARRRQDDRRPARRGASAGVRREPGRASAGARSPRAAASRSGPRAHGKPRQDGLGLGVAEAGVALEQDRAVVGEHQARVQRATERACRAGPARPGSAGGSVDAGSRRRPSSGRSGERAVGAHPAGVRARGRRRAVACGRGPPAAAIASWPSQMAMRLASRPIEPLLDDDPAVGRPRSSSPSSAAIARPPARCRTPSRPCRPPARPP